MAITALAIALAAQQQTLRVAEAERDGAGMKARGVDVAALVSKAGINVEELIRTIGVTSSSDKPAETSEPDTRA